MTTHADLTEVYDQRILADWALGECADRLLEPSRPRGHRLWPITFRPPHYYPNEVHTEYAAGALP
ncbi:hypothetical protein ACVWWN_005121 [Mycobacterium sp. URHB0021]|jgi:hypothetical protein